MAKATTTKPESVSRAGHIQCAAFPSEKGRSFSLSKSYKKDTKWMRQKISLFPYELQMLKQVIDETIAREQVK